MLLAQRQTISSGRQPMGPRMGGRGYIKQYLPDSRRSGTGGRHSPARPHKEQTMLAITDLKASLVSDVNLGRLVVFERGSQRLFALRVNAGRDVTTESAALLVFGLQDDGHTFSAVCLSNVGHERCM